MSEVLWKHVGTTATMDYWFSSEGVLKSVHKHTGKEHIMQTRQYKGQTLIVSKIVGGTGSNEVQHLIKHYFPDL